MDETPANLKNAAIVQIVAGLVNFFFMGYVASMGVGTVCGVLTLGMGGQLCGLFSCMLIPFGMLEIVVGGITLANPKGFGNISRMFGFVEIAALLLGGLPSALAGGIVVALTGNDEVKAYLQG